MIISLPLTTNTAHIFSSLLFKWKAERKTVIEETKQAVLKELRSKAWNKWFNKKTSDDDLMKQNSSLYNEYYWENYRASIHRKEEIDQLNSLLSAHKLSLLTETTSTYDLEDYLVSHLNKELGAR